MSVPEPVDPILEIAGALADETPVDWDDRLARTPALAPRLRHLRAIETIAALHRGADAADPGAGAPAPALFTWGPLRALERLGAGAFGEVYRAFDPALHREVALKLHRGDAAERSARRWLDEGRRLARVRHPNVLVVHGADVHDGRAGLWTDLLRGRTLEEQLAAHGPLGAEEAAVVGLELCRALAAVHAAGLTHGDLKAANVLREGVPGAAAGAPSGRIVLADFGSADELDGGASGSPGTPLATAPEVLAGGARTASSDLYALGALLFRLVTGRHPVDAGSLAELRSRLERGERARLRALRPDLPGAFVQAVERLLEPEPAARFADVAAVEDALGEVLRAAPPARPAARRPGAVALLAAAAAIVVALALLLPRGTHRGATGPPAAPAPAIAPAPDAGIASPPARSVPGRTEVQAPAPEVRLYRTHAGTREPIADGGRVEPGDLLSLEVVTREPLSLYVVNEDDRGEVFVLFPLPGMSVRNPLEAGRRHRIPGARDGRTLDWQVTSAGGVERFLIAASRRPVVALERQIATLARAEEGRDVRAMRLDLSAPVWRGLGGLAAPSPRTVDRAPGTLDRLAEALAAADSGALWLRRLELRNPIP